MTPSTPPPPPPNSWWIEGPRSYLWPDGSFRDYPPPSKPLGSWIVTSVDATARTITLRRVDD